jgi:hypothetical protein
MTTNFFGHVKKKNYESLLGEHLGAYQVISRKGLLTYILTSLQ